MMRLRAIRLKEFGCFRTARALEEFGDGLNVLAGQNELGKSTLLRALRAAFEEQFDRNNTTVRALAPYSGGAPLVEIERLNPTA